MAIPHHPPHAPRLSWAENVYAISPPTGSKHGLQEAFVEVQVLPEGMSAQPLLTC